MSEAASSAWERVKRAKLREIEAHRIAVHVHTSTAAYFESIGLEAQAAVVRKRAERARVMLETAIREAEAIPTYWSQPFVLSDSGVVVEASASSHMAVLATSR